MLAGRALGRQLTSAPRSRKARPTSCSSPAAAARCAATPTSSIGVETFEIDGEDDFVVGGRGLFETSTELRYRITERWGGVGFVDTGLVTEDGTLRGESDFRVGAGARRALLHQHRRAARRRRHAGHPARRGRLRSRSTSASGRRFETARGDPRRCSRSWRSPRWRRTPPTTESDNGFLINLLENRLSTPARQIRLQRRLRRALLAGADRAGHHLRPGGRLARDRQRRARLEPARAAARPGQRQPAERRARSPGSRRAEPPPPAGAALPSAEATPFALPELPVVDQARASSRFAEHRLRRAGVRPGGAELALGRLAQPRAAACSTRRSTSTASTPPGGDADAGGRLLERHPPARRRPRPARAAGRRSSRRSSAIEGTPAIDLTAEGSGPLDQVDVTFALDADRRPHRRRASSRCAPATTASASTSTSRGELAPLVPPDFRDFFAGEQHGARCSGVSKSAGGLRIDELTIAGAVLTLDGDLETGSRRLPARPEADRLARRPGRPAGRRCRCRAGDTRLQSAALHVDFGDASRWNGLVVLDRLEAAGIEHGGRDAAARRPRRRTSTTRRGATSRSHVEGLATGVWRRPTRRSPARSGPHRLLRRRRAAARRRRSRSASSS